MRANLAKQPFIVSILTFVVTVSLFLLRAYTLPTPFEQIASEPTPLGSAIDWVQSQIPILSLLITLLLIGHSGFRLSGIATRNITKSSSGSFSIVIYGVLACGIIFPEQHLTAACAVWTLAAAVRHLYRGLRVGRMGLGSIYLGAFWLGVLPLIYAPASILALAAIWSCIIFSGTIRALVASLIGLALPTFVACYINWAMGGEFLSQIQTLTLPYKGDFISVINNIALAQQIQLIIVLILTIIAIFEHIQNLSATKIITRRAFLFNIGLFCISTLMLALGASNSISFTLLTPALTLILPIFFIKTESTIALIAYAILLILPLIAPFITL